MSVSVHEYVIGVSNCVYGVRAHVGVYDCVTLTSMHMYVSSVRVLEKEHVVVCVSACECLRLCVYERAWVSVFEREST